MKNYTSSELQEMQRQAIERVREMQKRSQAVSRQASRDLGEMREDATEKPKEEKSTEILENMQEKKQENKSNQFFAPSERVRSVQLDTGLKDLYKDRYKNDERKEENKNDEKGMEKEKKVLLEGLDLDFDKALILSIILLLSSENVDKELVLALLYIVV